MKKYLIFFGLILAFLAPKSIAQASGGFVIESFKSTLTVQPDGRLRVQEAIVVKFNEPLHGIYRDLPVNYKNSDETVRYTKVDVQDVSDGNSPWHYEVIKNGANLRIKIGDPAVLVSGTKNYLIDYIVTGAISSFTDYDELYWNVTGNDWEGLINSASALVTIPSDDILKVTCYEGTYGATELCDSDINKAQAIFSAKRPLRLAEGLTVVTAFPKDTVPILKVDPPVNYFGNSQLKYIFFSSVIVIALAFVILLRLWWLKGRDLYYERKSLNDPLRKETILPLFGAYEAIVPEYEAPAKLRPGELGVLMDEKADMVDISATIVDLAVRGYLTITELPKTGLFGRLDYLLKKTGKSETELLEYEKILMEEIFDSRQEVKISDLKANFTSSLKLAKDSLYSLVKEKKLFFGNPDKVRNKYILIAQLLYIPGVAYLIFFSSLVDSIPNPTPLYINLFSISFGLGIGLVVLGVALMFFARLMPKRTAYGRDIYRQALGYKLFVSGTEKYRQPFFEKENIFMEVLPYAMIFGVTSKLASAMKEMGLTPTASWYIGASAFNANTFFNNINNFSDSLSATMAPASNGSGFGGGGFSGGGGGGGGGGGW